MVSNMEENGFIDLTSNSPEDTEKKVKTKDVIIKTEGDRGKRSYRKRPSSSSSSKSSSSSSSSSSSVSSKRKKSGHKSRSRSTSTRNFRRGRSDDRRGYSRRRSHSRHRSRSRHRRSRSLSRSRRLRHSHDRRSHSYSRGSHDWRRRRSHSHSRSHSRRSDSHDRRYHRRSYSRERNVKHSRMDPHIESEKEEEGVTTITNREGSKYLNARIFIGNISSEKVEKSDLQELYEKFGKVTGVSIHKGFAFVQFETEEEARTAVKETTGDLIKGSKIDVKMAAEGRKGPRPRRSPPPGFGRDVPPGPAPPVRDRSPLHRDPYADRYRDPYRDTLPPRDDRDPLPPIRDGRDPLPVRDGLPRREVPYYDDPYRRPPPPEDPYFDRYRDDPYRPGTIKETSSASERAPYRRDPYADPYAKDYPPSRDYPYDAPIAPPPRKLPAECDIIILNSQLRSYAASVERSLKAYNILCDITLIPEDRTIPQMIEEASRRNCLFAIVVNSQNEAHSSVTLNILHGTPQEHRNMPLEDAMSFVGRSFEKYLQSLREKAAATTTPTAAVAPPASRSPPFMPPPADISYLLNLLADRRQLTVEEIDKVIAYLQDRKQKMLGGLSKHETSENYSAASDVPSKEQEAAKQQQELQAKILSIFGASGSTANTTTSASTSGQSYSSPPGAGSSRSQSYNSMNSNGQQQSSGGSGVGALINFDNPTVQKALDNLISSGPNLLRNIKTTQAGSSGTSGGAAQKLGGYSSSYGGYGGAPRHPSLGIRPPF